MIRTNRNQFRKTMMSTNRIIKPAAEQANIPTIVPSSNIVMQYKNDDGKQVKMMNGKEVLKNPEQKTDLNMVKPKEKDEKVYLPGQRFLETLSKYKKKPKVSFEN